MGYFRTLRNYRAARKLVERTAGQKRRHMSVNLDSGETNLPLESQAQGFLRIGDKLRALGVHRELVTGAILAGPFDYAWVDPDQIMGIDGVVMRRVEETRLYTDYVPDGVKKGNIPFRHIWEIRKNEPGQIAAMAVRFTDTLDWGSRLIMTDFKCPELQEKALYFPVEEYGKWFIWTMYADEIARCLQDTDFPRRDDVFEDYVLARFYYAFWSYWHIYARHGDENSHGMRFARLGAELGIRSQALHELDGVHVARKQAFDWWEDVQDNPYTTANWAVPACPVTTVEDVLKYGFGIGLPWKDDSDGLDREGMDFPEIFD